MTSTQTEHQSMELFKQSVMNSKYNKGEKDEIVTKVDLFYLNQSKQYDKLVNIFGESASNGIHIYDVKTRKIVTDLTELKKTSGQFKADCSVQMINTGDMYNISIKSNKCAMPTILNHTPRTAKVFKPDGILHKHIQSLDLLMQEYIIKRTNKLIGEDILLIKLEKANDPLIRLSILNVLSYFMFDGTGRGVSKCSANSIIVVHKEKYEFIKCTNELEKNTYINSMYDKWVISLRNKGMPKNPSDYCMPWLYKTDESSKGSLHIRLK